MRRRYAKTDFQGEGKDEREWTKRRGVEKPEILEKKEEG